MAIISLVPETPVTAGLQKAVANTYALTALSQVAHWNVVGEDFFQLHGIFGDHYDALFGDIDLLAERIRALDGFVVGNLSKLNEMARMPSLTAPFEQDMAVQTLVDAHNINVSDLKDLISICGRAGDLVTQNMIMNLVEAEQKRLWMLKSFLKGSRN